MSLTPRFLNYIYLMRTVLTVLIIIAMLMPNPKVVGTVWIYKVGDGCVDTLRLKSNRKVVEYDCEMNYAFNGSFRQIQDTLIITVKDDSHSEDGGKPNYYKSKFIIRENALYNIADAQLINNKWIFKRAKLNKNFSYKRLR